MWHFIFAIIWWILEVGIIGWSYQKIKTIYLSLQKKKKKTIYFCLSNSKLKDKTQPAILIKTKFSYKICYIFKL